MLADIGQFPCGSGKAPLLVRPYAKIGVRPLLLKHKAGIGNGIVDKIKISYGS